AVGFGREPRADARAVDLAPLLHVGGPGAPGPELVVVASLGEVALDNRAKQIGGGWGGSSGHCGKRNGKTCEVSILPRSHIFARACAQNPCSGSKLAGIMNTTVWLSQIQSLVSLGFMSLFLLIELGLAWVLLFFRLADRYSPGNAWMLAYRFWVRVY